jgi:hypothetical protein
LDPLPLLGQQKQQHAHQQTSKQSMRPSYQTPKRCLFPSLDPNLSTSMSWR